MQAQEAKMWQPHRASLLTEVVSDVSKGSTNVKGRIYAVWDIPILFFFLKTGHPYSIINQNVRKESYAASYSETHLTMEFQMFPAVVCT